MITYFLNVGYGESIVIQNDDRAIIIDGGSGQANAQIGEIRLIDFLYSKEIKHIDLVICTHMHDDHIGGLAEVFEQYNVGKFICNMYSEVTFKQLLENINHKIEEKPNLQLFANSLLYYNRIREQIGLKDILVEEKHLGDCEEIYGITITFYGLTPEEGSENKQLFESICRSGDVELLEQYDANLNKTSLAMHITGVDMFLTGDLVNGYERYSIPQTDILKLTHHGQVDGMSQALLEKVQPRTFIICADKGRKFNSACPEILKRCDEYFQAINKEPQIYITGDLEHNGNGVMIEEQSCTIFNL